MNLEDYFYIYSPPWRNNAAGVKVLHILCDRLNKLGCKAWIVHTNEYAPEELPRHLKNLKIPILTSKLFQIHKSLGINPTVVYSETIPGNPLNANKVLRYYMHFPGALGGSTQFDEEEFPVAYSESIRKCVNNSKLVLHIPAVNIEELPLNYDKQKGLNLGYAGKYRAFVGKPKLPGDIKFTEIYREGRRRQSRSEVLELLGKAELLYLWENSTIAVEALLLKTPVILVPTPFLGPLIATHEFGRNGIAFDLSEEEIEFAKNTVLNFKSDYLKAIANIDNQLLTLIDENSKYWKEVDVLPDLVFPNQKPLRIMNSHSFRIFISIYKTKGLLTSIRILKEFVLKKTFRRLGNK